MTTPMYIVYESPPGNHRVDGQDTCSGSVLTYEDLCEALNKFLNLVHEGKEATMRYSL